MEIKKETKEFKSELRQILNIITHSLYSHKEIFLRELISNASDAIDRIRFDSLNNEQILEGNKDWKIKIIADKKAQTLTISDNGIGMSRDSIIENLGTIAKSGTKEFLEQLRAAEAAVKPELIGQFGVGFYSAFMVADTVTVVTRTGGDSTQGVRWTSDGQGEFTVEPAGKASRGTEVTLHIKEDEKEFLDEWRIKQIVKQFSDFIEHPVVMDVEKEDDKKKKTTAEETLNSQKAIWLRGKNDITKEEYEAFYKQISNDFKEPAKTLHYTGEGINEFKVLLFIPRFKSFDLQFGEAKVGPKLYIRRVLIMDHAEALLPPYLRFVKGVVDCPDLPLNVSREMLQHNPLLDKIQKNIVKNILKTLEEMKKNEYETYLGFFKELGSILKEGLNRDWSNREQIADLLLFESLQTAPGSFITLGQYSEKMPPDQKEILYLTGETREQIANTPHLEFFKSKGWDVLLMTDPVDEFVMPSLSDFKGKKLKAADRGEIDTSDNDSKEMKKLAEEMKPLFEAIKKILPDIKEVRLSKRLKESPACLVSDEGAMGAHMERLMQRLGNQDQAGQPQQRIFEINPSHEAVLAIQKLHTAQKDDPRIELYVHILHEQAIVAEGSKLKDPSGFTKRITELLVRDAG